MKTYAAIAMIPNIATTLSSITMKFFTAMKKPEGSRLES